MTTTPTLNGQVLGEAEHATRALLDARLREADTSFHHWVILNVLGSDGGGAAARDVVARMVHGLKIDEAVARRELGDAQSCGLVTVDAASDRIALTAAGQARFSAIREEIAAIGQRLYRDLPAEDLETAARVLGIVTERANAILTG